MIDLGLGVGGDERDQFDLPIQARLLAGAGPVVEVGFLQGGAQAVPGKLPEVGHRFNFVCHLSSPPG